MGCTPSSSSLILHPETRHGWCLDTSSRRLNTITRLLQNPAFGPTQIRELTEIFVEKATQVSTSQIYVRLFMLRIDPSMVNVAERILEASHLYNRRTSSYRSD